MDPEHDDNAGDEGGNETVVEHEVAVENNPTLPEVEVKTHEEEEEVLFKMRSKLFRFDPDSNQWKERGTGDVKLLKHKQTNKIRLLMRQEKTLKVCANHYIHPMLKLLENAGSDRSWTWKARDFSEGEVKEETLAIRFANAENAQQFKSKVEECKSEMEKVVAESPVKKAEAPAESAEKSATPEKSS